MKVLSFGSINYDFVYTVDHIVREGETLSSSELNVYEGGKGSNQSIAIARAGVKDVFHAGIIGTDGHSLLENLRNNDINADFVKIDNHAKTGNAFIQKDIEGNNSIIVYSGANHQVTKEYIEDVLSNFSKDDYLVIQNEINYIDYIIECAFNLGMRIAFNPSPIDETIKDLPLHKIEYLILNEIEAKTLLNIKLENNIDAIDLVKQLHKYYEKCKILLTLGENGSTYYDGNDYIHQPSIKTLVRDTTGAGDTFTGYFLAGIMQDTSIKTSMERASIAASLSISKEGASKSIPFIDEVIYIDGGDNQ